MVSTRRATESISVRPAEIARFLTGLEWARDADQVAQLLANLALHSTRPHCIMLHVAVGAPDSLTMIGSHGLDDDARQFFRTIPLSLPHPVSDAFMSDEAVSVPLGEAQQQFPVLRHPQVDALHTRWGTPQVLCLPVRRNGIPFATMTAIHPPVQWEPDDWMLLDALCATLGLWLTVHRQPEPAHLGKASGVPGLLTQRQINVLRLVDEGHANSTIADRLNVSVSLVKVELQRAMRQLGASDRDATVARAKELSILAHPSTAGVTHAS